MSGKLLGRSRKKSLARGGTLLGLGVALMLALAAMARAEEIPSEQCLSAHESAQLLRAETKLLDAKRELLTCQRLECPDIVRKDCVVWLDELEREIPSITVSAREDGIDQLSAKLVLDGVPVAESLNGQEIPLEPGPHTLVLTLPSGKTEERMIVMAVGEKARNVAFEWSTKVVEETPAPAAAPPPQITYERPIPPVTYYLTGLAGVGFLTAGGIGIATLIEKGSLSCAPFCDPGQKANLDGQLLAADIALGVGVAATIGAGAFYLFRPSVPSKASAGVTGVSVVLRGASLELGSRF